MNRSFCEFIISEPCINIAIIDMCVNLNVESKLLNYLGIIIISEKGNQACN